MQELPKLIVKNDAIIRAIQSGNRDHTIELLDAEHERLREEANTLAEQLAMTMRAMTDFRTTRRYFMDDPTFFKAISEYERTMHER